MAAELRRRWCGGERESRERREGEREKRGRDGREREKRRREHRRREAGRRSVVGREGDETFSHFGLGYRLGVREMKWSIYIWVILVLGCYILISLLGLNKANERIKFEPNTILNSWGCSE